MLGLRLGVRAPVPQGVDASFREVSYGAWEYMPQSVEEVRFKMERVRLGGALPYAFPSR